MLQQVMTEPGKIIFREIPVPEIGDGQVLVKIMDIGVCGSDIHVYHGKHPFTKYPVANDHELDIKSTMMYRHEDYVGAIELVEAGKVQLKPLISKIFPFAQYLDAYKYIDANRETTMKVIIAVQEK